MKEKDFQILFSKWAEENKGYIKSQYGKFSAFELKIEKSQSIRFDSLSPHQVIALKEVEDEGCYHKINDMPFIPDNPKMRFTNKKPFDCFFGCGNGYVVVWFYKKGQRAKDREMIIVPFSKWREAEMIAEDESRKSIKEDLLKEIGFIERFCF
ncbi:MAG: hypothetical protein EOL88_00650 [Bacteroidia bacterium]|nr:hypothetical protein [Bacteroidia bacterium]